MITLKIRYRRRTYGSSKESLSCYGGRKHLSSVSSSNGGSGAKKALRSKTPYSSLPPPPVKKKNLTKVRHFKIIMLCYCQVVAVSNKNNIFWKRYLLIFMQPHNGCDFERLISIADGNSGASKRGSTKEGFTDKVSLPY